MSDSTNNPNCEECKHYALGDCAGKDDAWHERVAICVAEGVSEDRAVEIACEEVRTK